MALDLKKFKKIDADKTHTIFEHPDGHIIKVAHKAISKSMHNEVRQLPMKKGRGYFDGGRVVDEQLAAPQEEFAYPEMEQPGLSVNSQLINAEQGNIAPPQEAGLMPLQADINVPPPGTLMPDEPLPPDRQPQAQGMPAAADAAQGYARGVSDIRKGLMNEAKAEGEAGKAEAAALAENQKQMAELQAKTQARWQELTEQRQHFMSDIENGHIDPNKYLNSLSTGGKIVTAIGLIMGGMGAGLTGGENPAMKFISQQIDRDIEGQKAELGKKMNLLSANMQEFGNLKDATEMTRIMMNDAVSMKIKQAAALSKDPVAQARAMQAAGKLEMESAPTMATLAMRSAALKGMKSGALSPTHAVRYLIEDKADQKTATEEIEMINGYKQAVQEVNDAFAKAAKIGGIEGNLPFGTKKTEMKVLRAGIEQALRGNMKGQGAISDKDMGSLTPFFPEETDREAQLQLKLKGMINVLNNKVQGGTPLLDRYNIPIDREAPQFDTQRQRMFNFAKANPKDPKSKIILQTLGISGRK